MYHRSPELGAYVYTRDTHGYQQVKPENTTPQDTETIRTLLGAFTELVAVPDSQTLDHYISDSWSRSIMDADIVYPQDPFFSPLTFGSIYITPKESFTVIMPAFKLTRPSDFFFFMRMKAVQPNLDRKILSARQGDNNLFIDVPDTLLQDGTITDYYIHQVVNGQDHRKKAIPDPSKYYNLIKATSTFQLRPPFLNKNEALVLVLQSDAQLKLGPIPSRLIQ